MTHAIDKFFTDLFASAVSDERQIVVWCKGQPSSWCASVPAAVQAAKAGAAGHDVYFGCSLQNPKAALASAHSRASAEGKPKPSLASTRGVATTACAIPGLWADIDLAGDGHKNKNYPPDLDEALKALRVAIPIEPSLIVSTGGGVHVWWLLKEAWAFEGEPDRLRAQDIVRGFQESIRLQFAEHGWKLDSTHDLSRVLRVPGTFNRKKDYGEPRECTIIHDGGARYELAQLAEHASLGLAKGAKTGTGSGERAKVVSELTSSLLISTDASLPPQFEFAMQDPKFRLTWEEKRGDLADGSPSSYDFAIMLWCLARAWRDQHVVDVCEARRRRNGHEAKDTRYYALSLSRAKERIGMTQAEERLIEHASEVEAEGMTSTRKSEILADLGSRLGIKLLRVERLLMDEPAWDLVLEGGERAHIGPIEAVRDCRRFTNAMAKVLKREFPDMNRQRWKAISSLVLAVSEDVDFGEESIHGGEAPTQWLNSYLQTYRPTDDPEVAATDKLPLVDDKGRLYVALSHFRRWLFMSEREDWNRTSLARLLRSHGWERRTIGIGATTRSLWSPPIVVGALTSPSRAPIAPM
jgi:hypothetical protein